MLFKNIEICEWNKTSLKFKYIFVICENFQHFQISQNFQNSQNFHMTEEDAQFNADLEYWIEFELLDWKIR